MPDPQTLPENITAFQNRLRTPQILTSEDVTTVSDAIGQLSDADQKQFSQQLRQLRVGVEQASVHDEINADAKTALLTLRGLLPEPGIVDNAAHHGQHLVDDANEIVNQAPAFAENVIKTAKQDAEDIRNEFGKGIGAGTNAIAEKGLGHLNTYRDLHQSDNYLIRGAAYALTGLGVYWLAQKIMGTNKTGFFGKILRGLGLVALATGVSTFINRHNEKPVAGADAIISTLPADELVDHAPMTIKIAGKQHQMSISAGGVTIDGIVHTITLTLPGGKTDILDIRSVQRTANGKLHVRVRKPGDKTDKEYDASEKEVGITFGALQTPPHIYEKTFLGAGVRMQRA